MTEQEQHPISPETTSYEITAIRKFEVDFSEQQVEMMMQQTDADTAEEAIEQSLLQPEIDHIQPEQKLIGANVDVDEASNN